MFNPKYIYQIYIYFLKGVWKMAEMKHGQNEFYLEAAGQVIGKIQYEPSGTDVIGRKQITVTHTEVDKNYGGKGYGKQLVQKIASYAKQENLAIVPQCSYAKKVLESQSEYADLIAK